MPRTPIACAGWRAHCSVSVSVGRTGSAYSPLIRIEYFEAYGACEWAGYILALDIFRLAPPEFGRLFEDSAPTVVIFRCNTWPPSTACERSFPY